MILDGSSPLFPDLEPSCKHVRWPHLHQAARTCFRISMRASRAFFSAISWACLMRACLRLRNPVRYSARARLSNVISSIAWLVFRFFGGGSALFRILGCANILNFSNPNFLATARLEGPGNLVVNPCHSIAYRSFCHRSPPLRSSWLRALTASSVNPDPSQTLPLTTVNSADRRRRRQRNAPRRHHHHHNAALYNSHVASLRGCPSAGLFQFVSFHPLFHSQVRRPLIHPRRTLVLPQPRPSLCELTRSSLSLIDRLFPEAAAESNAPAQLQTSAQALASAKELLASCPTKHYLLASVPDLHAADIRGDGSGECHMPNLCRAVRAAGDGHSFSVAEVVGVSGAGPVLAEHIAAACADAGRTVKVDQVDLARLPKPSAKEGSERREVLEDNGMVDPFEEVEMGGIRWNAEC